MGRVAQGEDPREYNIRQTALAYKTQAITLGYSFLAHVDQEKDAGDGGQQIFEDFLNTDISTITSCAKLLKLAGKLKEIAAGWDQTHSKLAKAEIKAAHACPKKGIDKMSRAIGSPPSSSLQYVKRDGYTQDGKEEGTLTANATTIDGVITRAWQSVVQGNVSNPKQCVDDFIQKHGRSMHKHAEVHAPDITTERVFQAL